MSAFSDEDVALMERTAQALVQRRLAVPALMFLETVSPMNMVSASMLQLMSPAWRAVLPGSRIDGLAALLERRDALPELMRRIEAAEQARRDGADDPEHASSAGHGEDAHRSSP